MEYIILIAIPIISALNIACFLIGAKVGQMVVKDEPIEVKLPDPLKAIRENEERKEAKREQDKLETIMRNIDNYDGTGNGQEDV